MHLPQFVKDLIERSGSTFGETMAAGLVIGVPVYGQDWKTALGVAGTATLIAVGKCLAAGGFFGDKKDASLVTLPTAPGR